MTVSGSIDSLLSHPSTFDQSVLLNHTNVMTSTLEVDDMDDAIEDLLRLITQHELAYYTSTNSQIYLNVHLSNPDHFVILSFILNGIFYQSYQFEDGSDSENLILEVNSGAVPGHRLFTIDAIKYVDGTEIKDVLFQGNDTIEIGVQYEVVPSSNLSIHRLYQTSCEALINIEDPYDLIIESGNILKWVVYDGQSVIKADDLHLGTNTMSMDGLMINQTYQYAVFTIIDLLDGNQKQITKLASGEFQTLDAISLNTTDITQTSIDFSLNEMDIENVGSIQSVKLYHDTVLVEQLPILENYHVINLFSDTTYTIEIDYEYLMDQAGGPWSYIKLIDITTIAKAKPIVEVSALSSTTTSITFDLNDLDPDLTTTSWLYEVFLDGTQIHDYVLDDSHNLSNLLPHRVYDVNIIFHYDLNDGEGIQTDRVTFSYPTLALPISITHINTMNVFGLKVGDSLQLHMDITNPQGVLIDSLVIHDQVISVMEGSTPTFAMVQFVPDYQGGLYDVDVHSFSYTFGDYKLTQNIIEHVTHIVPILGSLNIIEFHAQEGNLVGLDNLDPQLWIELEDDNLYVISSLTVVYGPTNTQVILSSADITMMDNHTLGIPSLYTVRGSYPTNIVSITYGFEGFSPLIVSSNTSLNVLVLNSLSIHQLLTRQDMTSMESGYRYQLMNDIDLSDAPWLPLALNYVFIDGGGYQLQHMTISLSTTTTDPVYSGLFSTFSGVIKNLHMTNLSINISTKGDVYVGGMIGRYMRYTQIERCSLQGTIVVQSTKNVHVGGVLGYTNSNPYYLFMQDIYTHITFNIPTALNGYIGGVIGSVASILSTYQFYHVERIFAHSVIAATLGSIGQIGGILGSPGASMMDQLIARYAFVSGQMAIQYVGSDIRNVQVGPFVGSFYDQVSNLYSSHSYSIILNNQNVLFSDATRATLSMENDSQFYTNMLKFDPSVWKLNDLNYLNGIHPNLIR
jgi:hypothetical protein